MVIGVITCKKWDISRVKNESLKPRIFQNIVKCRTIFAVLEVACCSGVVRGAKAREVGCKVKTTDLGHAAD